MIRNNDLPLLQVNVRKGLIIFNFHHRQVGSVNEIVYRKKKMNRRLLIKHMPSINLTTTTSQDNKHATNEHRYVRKFNFEPLKHFTFQTNFINSVFVCMKYQKL